MGLRGLLGRVRRVLSAGPADPLAATSRFWTRVFEQASIRTWAAEERCRLAINERVTGSPNEWPMEWFKRVYAATAFRLGLSLGCGDGALERDVRRKGICDAFVGVDTAEGALRLSGGRIRLWER